MVYSDKLEDELLKCRYIIGCREHISVLTCMLQKREERQTNFRNMGW